MEVKQPILSKELKEDKKLKLSNVNEKGEERFQEIISNAMRPIKIDNLKDKINVLRESISSPNNYVFVSFANRVYEERKNVQRNENLYGKKLDQTLGNWQLLTIAENKSKLNGYVGAAYWNPDTQQVIISHRGTEPGDFSTVLGTLLTDIKSICLNQHSPQINSAVTFTDKIISVLRKFGQKNEKSYIQLFFTGHSLGGWLAQITTFTAKYLIKGAGSFVENPNFEETGYHASTVVFDSPGGRSILERMQDRLMSRYSHSLINSLDVVSYLSAPNLVNTCNTHVGEVYRIFMILSEKDKLWMQKSLGGYTRLMHKRQKFIEVFDPQTGRIYKDESGNLRVEKVYDWPLLISGDEEGAIRGKIAWSADQIARYVLPGIVTMAGECAYLTYKGKKWYDEFTQELKEFFVLANESNEYHLKDKDMNVEGNSYRSIRYKTEKLDKNYENEHSLNVFTEPERQFLKEYKVLQKYEKDLPNIFKLEQLFSDFDEELKSKTIKLLEEYKVENGKIFAIHLLEFIPYIKRMLYFFPDIKNETKKAWKELSVDVLCGIYQSASSSYLQSLDKSLDFAKDTFDLEDFLTSNSLKVLHTVQSNTSLGAIQVCKIFKIIKNDCHKGKSHAFLNLDRTLYLGEEIFINFLEKINYQYSLVIECNDALSNKIEVFFEELFKALQDNQHIKVILVTEKDSELSKFISEYVMNNPAACREENNEVKWNDLTSDSQRKLLEKTVVFQGNKVPLSIVVNDNDVLDTIIDPETIVELFENKEIEIGKVLPNLGEAEDYYVDRKLAKNIKIKHESDLPEDKYLTAIKIVDIKDISEFDEKLIIVAAEPGMGKTIALTRLGTHKTDDSQWLIRINLIEYKDELEQRNFVEKDSIVEFLSENNVVSNALAKKLLESRLNNSGNIVFLLDGFGEITSQGQKNVINLLKKLQETKVEKVLISTRLHFRNKLENSLSTIAYTLKPFSREDQKQFLMKFWQRNSSINEISLGNYINELLEFLSESIGDKERRFMGIPMQMKMVAEAFQEGLAYPEQDFPENFDMLKLYDRFLYVKYLVYFGKRMAENIDLDNEDWITTKPTEVHRNLAFKVLFPEMEKDFIAAKLPSEKNKQRVNKVGIAQCINDEIVFTHHTFAEYFAAGFLVDRLSRGKKSRKYQATLEFLAKELFESKNEVIKTFLDYYLAKNRVHAAILKGNLDLDDVLSLEENISIIDNLGRIALHYAAQEGCEEVVDILLKKEANAETTDNLDKTALHYAARYNRRTQVVNCLLEKTKDCINNKDKNGRTAVYYAAQQGNWDIVDRILTEKDASIDGLDVEKLLFHYTDKGSRDIIQNIVRNENIDVTAIKDNHDNTLLHIATQKGHSAIVKFLLKEKADVDVTNNSGRKPISYAAEGKHWKIVVSVLRMKNTQFNDLNDDVQKLSLLKYSAQNAHWDIIKLFMQSQNNNRTGKDKYFDHLNDKQKMHCLYYLISIGDLDTTKFFIKNLIKEEKISNVNTSNSCGKTFLHLAAQYGQLNIVQYLVDEKGADINAVTNNGSTPLHLAASPGNLKVAQYLVKEKRADWNIKDNDGYVPLHYASSSGKLEVVKYLVEAKGVDFNVKDNDGETPLHLAAFFGKLEVVQYLVEAKGADLNIKDTDGYTSLHLALWKRQWEIATLLIEKGASLNIKDHDGETPLHLAAFFGELEVVKYLVEAKGIDLNIKDNYGDTPLHLAISSGKLKIIQYLIQAKGVDLNCFDGNGRNPLHLVLWKRQWEIATLLIEKGVDLNIKDNYGKTLLHLAASSGKLEVIKHLVEEKEMDLNIKDSYGEIPLHIAAFFGELEVVKYLVEAKGVDFNVKDNDGETPLHLAASSDKLKVVKYLIEVKGADFNIKDKDGATPLHIAAFFGKLEVVKYLVEKGADFNIEDRYGRTFLHWAAKKGKLDVVKYLVEEKRADPNIRDKYNNTPLDLAKHNGYWNIVTLLSSNQPQIQSHHKQQKAYLHLSKFLSNHFLNTSIEPVKQELYLPSFEARNLKINGKCTSITRGLSQAAFFGNQQQFLSNLAISTELYERLAKGKQISDREKKEIFAFSKLLDSFAQQLDSPMSSLPSALIYTKGYGTLNNLSRYIAGMKDDFAIHLVTSTHVVAIYRKGNTYSYFDTNVAFVSKLKSVAQLMQVIEKGIKSAGYEVGEKGLLVEHFDVAKANSQLSNEDQQILAKKIKTERQLLAEQDKEFGLIKINGQEISRVQLYNFGTKINVAGGVPLLINADMNLSSKKFQDHLDKKEVSMTAREYLDSLKNDKNVKQATQFIPFAGSKREIAEAEQVRSSNKTFSLQQLTKGIINQIFSIVSQNNANWPGNQLPGKADNKPKTHLSSVTTSDKLTKTRLPDHK